MIVKIGEGELLILIKEVTAHIRLHTHADEVTVIANDVEADRLQNVHAEKNGRGHNEPVFLHIAGLEATHDGACNTWVNQVADRDDQSTDHIQREERNMRLVILNKSFNHTLYPFLYRNFFFSSGSATGSFLSRRILAFLLKSTSPDSVSSCITARMSDEE